MSLVAFEPWFRSPDLGHRREMQFCIVRPDTLGEIQDMHVRFGFFDLTDQTRAVMPWRLRGPTMEAVIRRQERMAVVDIAGIDNENDQAS
jgi:hypothetical protein